MKDKILEILKRHSGHVKFGSDYIVDIDKIADEIIQQFNELFDHPIEPKKKPWLINIEIDCDDAKEPCKLGFKGQTADTSLLFTGRYDTKSECEDVLRNIRVPLPGYTSALLLSYIDQAISGSLIDIAFDGVEVSIQIIDTEKNSK